MIVVSTGGLIINMVGLFFFSENDQENKNIYGLFLHVLADTLGSLSVLVACFLVNQYQMHMADPICAMIVSVMIFLSVIPLIWMSCQDLLIQTPQNILENRQKIIDQFMKEEGITNVR